MAMCDVLGWGWPALPVRGIFLLAMYLYFVDWTWPQGRIVAQWFWTLLVDKADLVLLDSTG